MFASLNTKYFRSKDFEKNPGHKQGKGCEHLLTYGFSSKCRDFLDFF